MEMVLRSMIKQLHDALKYLKETPDFGIQVLDIPFNQDSVLIG